MLAGTMLALALCTLLTAAPAAVTELAAERAAIEEAALTALAETDALSLEDAAFLPTLAQLPHYDAERAERYLAARTEGRTLGAILRLVNTDSDLPRFTTVSEADPADGLLILVNKYHPLPEGYVPDDLVTVEPAYSNGGKLTAEANDAFCALVEALWQEEGLHLVNASAYRSYATQRSLYARYYARDGAVADRYSARAGYSEHQTGLALDVIAPGGTLNGFQSTAQFAWMRDNAHRFGFILRYGEGQEEITGYKFEPWHYRYVGLEAAEAIHAADLTLEEYIAYR